MKVLLSATSLLIGLAVVAPGARADSLPFTDPDAQGSIGLCDTSGHQVVRGELGASPFVWKAISSAATPKGYDIAGGKATLLAYQPRTGVSPGEWSGGQLTASSTYTSKAHPVAQATKADGSLLSFVQAYPAKWDGLVQLRFVFSGPGLPPSRRSYPATVVRVQGSHWEVVNAVRVDCKAGNGTSAETVALPASRLQAPPTAPVAVNRASPQPSSSAQAIPTSSAAPQVEAQTPVSQRTDPGRFLGSPVGWVVLLGLLILLAGLVATLRRRFGSPGSP